MYDTGSERVIAESVPDLHLWLLLSNKHYDGIIPLQTHYKSDESKPLTLLVNIRFQYTPAYLHQSTENVSKTQKLRKTVSTSTSY